MFLVDCFDIIEKEFLLRRFAVRVLGTLFRSTSSDDTARNQFIELLKLVAVTKSHGIDGWVHTKEIKGTEKEILLGERSCLEIFHLHLEAIKQLGLCLCAPFSELPHIHGSVPMILKALCDIACFHSIDDKKSQSCAEHGLGQCKKLMLTLTTILPLARLSSTRNGQVMFMS